MQEDQWLACMYQATSNISRAKRHPQDTPRNEPMTFDNKLPNRNKKQKAGARHEVKENMAGLSATSISCFFVFII